MCFLAQCLLISNNVIVSEGGAGNRKIVGTQTIYINLSFHSFEKACEN